MLFGCLPVVHATTYDYYLCGANFEDWYMAEYIVVPSGATANGWVSAEAGGAADSMGNFIDDGQAAWATIEGPGVDLYVDAFAGESFYQSFSGGGPGTYSISAGQQWATSTTAQQYYIDLWLLPAWVPDTVWDASQDDWVTAPQTHTPDGRNTGLGRAVQIDHGYMTYKAPATAAVRLWYSL